MDTKAILMVLSGICWSIVYIERSGAGSMYARLTHEGLGGSGGKNWQK